jgi:site-specific recombinase XerD
MKKGELLSQFKDQLTIKNYRPQTIKSYVCSMENFLEYTIANPQPKRGIKDYARAFLLQRFREGKSWSTVNVDYSAIRMLFVNVLHISWDYEFIPRPRGRSSLPSILSGKQVESMINLVNNLKHKTIITLIYTTGIRIGEVVNLNVSDLLLDRSQLKVADGKGGKDRIIAIPKTGLSMIKSYLEYYRPTKILIEGNPREKRYSRSSISKIIKRSAKSAGVAFAVSAHSLRYAYATHHIENGTDLVYLQHQMGHKQINTTLKYVKLCKNKPRHINHPIAKLNIKLPSQIT